ncbi:hypothetical protein Trydic_g14472 [Trypoxylus dichotomus]
MATNISISKGVFVFKNNAKKLRERKGSSGLINFNVYSEEPWYHTYINQWKNIEKKICELNKETFSSILIDLVNFIKDSYSDEVSEIPAAALLTGINMPDHVAQFSTLLNTIRQDITPHVACVYSQDCQNIKMFVENMIDQFVNKNVLLLKDECQYEMENKYKVKKTQLNFSMLQAWYEREHDTAKQAKLNKFLRKHQRKVLVVILPDLESFNERILQEFLLICSSYINILPFVFVFGIATSLSILHKILPYHVSSKVNIQYFNSQSSTVYLNNILENVFFTNDCPFHLGAKVFNLLLDVFLFYDLSVTGFITKFKYAMLEHFSYGAAMTLCTKRNSNDVIEKFSHEDCENVRRLLSFRRLVDNESNRNKIKLLTDDDYFKSVLQEEIFADLPKNQLGKQIRELYSKAVASDITKSEEYGTCIQLLRFQSKDDLQDKLSQIAELIQDECKANYPNKDSLKKDLNTLYEYLDEIENWDKDVDVTDMLVKEVEKVKINNTNNRKQFKEMLHKGTQKSKASSKYEAAKEKVLQFLSNLFEKYLYCPTNLNFHEIFFFDDVSIENHIIGSHRAAIHTALNDPCYYLQCNCCKKENEASILKTMPDICIIYKLHLEYGKMINLYDWLQAFVSIVSPSTEDDEEENDNTDPFLQARFTLAVAELEFLGFIKSSKRKADHVQRLTWGG